MATPVVTGPVHIWVSIPNSQIATLNATAAGLTFAARSGLPAAGAAGAAAALARLATSPVYLGTGQRGPRVKIRRAYSRVFNDLTGPELAFDKIWAGEEALIFVDLTRWNETAYDLAAGRPFSGGVFGAEPPGSRGTLMMTEGAAFPLILRFPSFDFHPAIRNNLGFAGYRFLAASLEGDDDFETGSGANIRHIAFHCQEIYDPKSNGLALCDFGVEDLVPPLAPN